IEFDIAPAAIRLEIPLALPVGEAPAAIHHGEVRRQELIADAALQAEAALEAAFAQIVEEDPAYAAGLAAVLEIEILVAPAFEAGVEIGPERLERGPAREVEMARIVLEAV